ATYRPAVKRRAMQKQVARDLLTRFFSGSAEDLVLQLLDDERLSPQQLKSIEAAYRRKSKRETDK
ncbi:MAG: BlaI/MecI/CopY family transcriptional regulator, partial [Candidatus Binatia bacterium]